MGRCIFPRAVSARPFVQGKQQQEGEGGEAAAAEASTAAAAAAAAGAAGTAATASENNLIINYLPSHITEIELRVRVHAVGLFWGGYFKHPTFCVLLVSNPLPVRENRRVRFDLSFGGTRIISYLSPGREGQCRIVENKGGLCVAGKAGIFRLFCPSAPPLKSVRDVRGTLYLVYVNTALSAIACVARWGVSNMCVTGYHAILGTLFFPPSKSKVYQ